jgi:hypothetical protein
MKNERAGQYVDHVGDTPCLNLERPLPAMAAVVSRGGAGIAAE